MKRAWIIGTVLCLSILALTVSSGFCQKVGSKKLEGTKVTVTGKIDYRKDLGGYFVRGEKPPEVYFIVNPDSQLLETLFKSKRTITIEGHYTIGADHLLIEKLDEKPYPGTSK